MEVAIEADLEMQESSTAPFHITPFPTALVHLMEALPTSPQFDPLCVSSTKLQSFPTPVNPHPSARLRPSHASGFQTTSTHGDWISLGSEVITHGCSVFFMLSCHPSSCATASYVRRLIRTSNRQKLASSAQVPPPGQARVGKRCRIVLINYFSSHIR